jgi:hypothetical protein
MSVLGTFRYLEIVLFLHLPIMEITVFILIAWNTTWFVRSGKNRPQTLLAETVQKTPIAMKAVLAFVRLAGMVAVLMV